MIGRTRSKIVQDKSCLNSVFILLFVLAIGLSNKVSKGAKLEFDEQASSAGVSVSMSVYAGTESDTDTWQDSGIVYDHNMAVYTAVGGAWSSGSASIHSDVSSAYSDEDWYIETTKLFEFVYNQHFWASPFEDANHQITPASFSVQLDASGNLYWNLLPTNPNEKEGDPVVIALWDWYGVGSNSGNMIYQMGTSKEYWAGSNKLGPYYVGCFCPSCDCNTNDPHGPIGLIARLGDKIKLSYNVNADGHSSDDTQYSEYVDSVYGYSIQLSIRAEVEPLNVTFLDKRWVSENNLLNALQNREELSPEIEQEAEAHAIVEGACADGATQLILIFDLCDWSLLFEPCDIPADTEDPTAVRLSILSPDGKDNGKLITDGQDNDNDGYDDIPRIKNGTFTQTWCAPPVFDSNLANKEKMRKIPIQIEIDKDGDGIYDCNFIEYIELVRPPVVMVHGLWGHGWDFNTLLGELFCHGFVFLYNSVPINNSASFEENDGRLQSYISNVFKWVRSTGSGYACSKVDIVAHSMGGLLAKRLDPAFARQNVRKIITIGTPYKGSPLADLLYQSLLDSWWRAGLTQTAINLLTLSQNSITGGAIYDLRSVDINPKLSSIPTEIPGVDCRGVAVGLWDGHLDLRQCVYIDILRWAFKKYSVEATHDLIFGQNDSDWVVPELSQRGNATSWQTRSVAWHCTELQDADIITLVIDWLNEPAQPRQAVGSLMAEHNIVPKTQEQHVSLVTENTSSWHLMTQNVAEPNGTVEIIVPTEGQTCTAGESITISVQGTGDTTQAAVFAFLGTSPWSDIVELPWEGEVNIPPDTVGSAGQIMAMGLDVNMDTTAVDEVNVVLDTNVVLEERSLGFSEWYFDFKNYPRQAHQLQLYPSGRFSDGSEYPLSVLGNQTTYQSLNECVATVDPNGIITVHSKGQASIVVTNSSITTTVLIEVDTYSGDLDLDGDVDFVDFALFANQWQKEGCIDLDGNGGVTINDLAIFTEHWLEGTWHPIPGDLNSDSKINFVDYALFANHWMDQNCVEPNWCSGADLDKSSTVDLYDLGKFAEYWLEGTIP
jgi:pimeloyl-ACP methyl ester carboxylesterase